VGVDLILRVDNRQVIENATRSKPKKREKSGFEVRNRNMRIFDRFIPHVLSSNIVLYQSNMKGGKSRCSKELEHWVEATAFWATKSGARFLLFYPLSTKRAMTSKTASTLANSASGSRVA